MESSIAPYGSDFMLQRVQRSLQQNLAVCSQNFVQKACGPLYCDLLLMVRALCNACLECANVFLS